MTTHLTAKPISILENSEQKYSPEFKPQGIWYQVDNSWRDWCSSEMPHWLADYKHEFLFDIDYTNIYVISNEQELREFTTNYQKKIQSDYPYKAIDWRTLAKEYKGIEIPNYLYSCRMEREFLWYYGWDVASGCIWDVSAIKNYKQLEL